VLTLPSARKTDMSGAEVGLVLGLISSIITIIETTYQLYEAVEDEKGLPANFKKAASKVPLISKILDDAEKYIESVQDEDKKAALKSTLENCNRGVLNHMGPHQTYFEMSLIYPSCMCYHRNHSE